MFSLVVLGAAHIHLHDAVAVLRRRTDAEVALVVDADRARADRWAGEFGAMAATTVDDLGGFDAAMIYAEPSARGPYVDLVARSQLPCFLEKPLAITTSKADAVAQTLPQRAQLGHFLRYWPALTEMTTLIRRGVIGQPSSFQIEFTHQGERAGWFSDDFEWMRAPSEGGGGFFDLAVHCVDALIALGQSVDEVVDWTPTSPHHGVAKVRLRSGATATIEAGWSASSMTICVEASGPAGTLIADRGELRHDGNVVAIDAAPTAQSAIDRWLDVCFEEAHEAELVPLADAVTGSAVLAALRELDDARNRDN